MPFRELLSCDGLMDEAAARSDFCRETPRPGRLNPAASALQYGELLPRRLSAELVPCVRVESVWVSERTSGNEFIEAATQFCNSCFIDARLVVRSTANRARPVGAPENFHDAQQT